MVITVVEDWILTVWEAWQLQRNYDVDDEELRWPLKEWGVTGEKEKMRWREGC
jgi:hypothetical protein